MKRVLLFDADGTILDFEKSEENAFYITSISYKIKSNEKIFIDYKIINNNLWESFEKGEITKAELVNIRFKKLFTLYNLDIDDVEFNKSYLDNLKLGGYKIDHAEEVLKELIKENTLFLVTNGIEYVQNSRLKFSGLDKYFSKIYVSEKIGYQKPKIEFFNYIFKDNPDLDFRNSLIIGDSLTSDILGGNNANIKTVWFNPNNKINQTNAIVNYEIKDLREILNIK